MDIRIAAYSGSSSEIEIFDNYRFPFDRAMFFDKKSRYASTVSRFTKKRSERSFREDF